MTPQERLDYLTETVETANTQPITGGEIVSAVGMDVGRLVIGTIQAAAAQDPLVAIAFQALSTVGMRLDLPERQAMVDQLAVAGSWPDAVRDAVKGLGVLSQPRWQKLGMDNPTIESVTAQIESDRLINATALFGERMTADGDADAVWSQAWIDTETV